MARGGRRNKERRGKTGITQLPFERVFNPFKPVEFMPPEGINAIDDAAMTILEEVGMEFLHDEALLILKAHGARVEAGSQRVTFDRRTIREYVARAPEQFILKARNPAHDVGFGGNEMVFAMVASAPNCSDLHTPRHPGTMTDFELFVRLGQMLNAVHVFGGYPVEPVDLPAATRHLDCIRSFIVNADKPIHAYSLGRTRILDAIELVKLGYGLSEEEFAASARLISIINTNSPLRLDGPMIEGMIELGRRNQACVITPFTLSGAMAPATIGGALAQQHAEALAGIAFYQMINPGAPTVYGGFTSNVDMKSGAPAFGTPEYVRSTMIGGQLARKYKMPFRTSNVNAANSVDAQASYESMFSLWALTMGGGNFVMHAAGWMEGGLTCNLEKIVLDAELIQMVRTMMEPIPTDPESLGLDAVREVGPGGHFFGAQHTLARFENAFHAPMLSDWRNFESWREAGSPTTPEHANRVATGLLETYRQPPIEQSRLDAMDEFVARRTAQGGAPI